MLNALEYSEAGKHSNRTEYYLRKKIIRNIGSVRHPFSRHTGWWYPPPNRVQVVFSGTECKLFSGFSVRLLCFVQAKTLCMYFFDALVLVCVDVKVMSSA